MTATVLDLSTIKHLDFEPTLSCEGEDCDSTASWRIRMVCGCVGLLCLRCLAAFKKRIQDCIDYAVLRGATRTWFDCVICRSRMYGWPIAEVRAL